MLIPFQTLIDQYQCRPKGVLHCGANIGEEAEAYKNAGAEKVVWVEANPEIYKTLCSNIEKYPNHVALNHCISDRNDQEVTFHIANNGGQSSSFLEFGTHARNHPTVKYIDHIQLKTKRLDSMDIDFEGLDFFAADLQGVELFALKGLGENLKQFKWVYLEVNREQVYLGNALVGEIDQYLKGFGLRPRAEKWTSASWGDKFYSK